MVVFATGGIAFLGAPEIAYLEVAARTVRESDPRKRPVWMYRSTPTATPRILAQTARHLDIVGKGMYVNSQGHENERVWCRWTIEQETHGIAETNPERHARWPFRKCSSSPDAGRAGADSELGPT